MYKTSYFGLLHLNIKTVMSTTRSFHAAWNISASRERFIFFIDLMQMENRVCVMLTVREIEK